MSLTRDYLERILTARVYDVAIESPLDAMPLLSTRLGKPVLLKREDLQPVFSFKLRGAYNKIHHLHTRGELGAGVIAASAGNHAQGVALAAERLGLRAVIVMPATTPAIKVNAVRRRGGEVVLHGDAYDEAYAHARSLAKQEGLTFIHPYDDPEVIAGQGTIGMEILRQHPDPIEAVFVPVGGGGLIAGVAAYLKHLRPATRIIGVEPEDAACMHAALAADARVVLPQVGLFADGVAVRQAGEETFRIARECVDEVILVSTDEISAAIKDIFDDTRAIAEPAGALAIAGLKRYVSRTPRANRMERAPLIAINSGANMNFDRLRHIAERAELGEQREALFAVTIPERPGSFRAFCETLGRRAITEFNYRFNDARDAHIFVGIQLDGGAAEKEALITLLRERGYPVLDMTGNEMAKLHVRHMVGGHGPRVEHEILYRFEFPERPGALLHFLTRMGARWNISLFHYRNHGADYGRVLVGIQVPAEERHPFEQFLEALGYPYWDESDNPAYNLFLA
ncbi:threonine ammonia-lyase, biosynthetic [Thiofaba sp. EF100]|uniref:threonine ammonia-lyase, biosynthetic n=1 Tax=Thiofaba sp. EF100 TaxID=3121274 RepID=UPI0032219CEF